MTPMISLPARAAASPASFLWLDCCNRILYEKGLITERERRGMELKISGRQGRPL